MDIQKAVNQGMACRRLVILASEDVDGRPPALA